jgi:hypothetical protein
MSSIVVVPTAKRPEFLALSLEKLRAVPDCPPVIISVDYVSSVHQEAEMAYVYKEYAVGSSSIVFQPKHTLNPHSGTWNILQSIKLGYETGANRVFLVEEDVMVYPYWKEWHDSMLNTGEYVASCGRLRPSTLKYYGPMYTNPGSCLTRRLLDAVMPHINDVYFEDSGLYCERVFGQRGFGGSSLDDGLIRAVIAQIGGKVAYPEKPVCAHQGWKGYSLGFDIYANKGDIKQRITGLRTIIARIQPGERYAQDFESYLP